MTTKPGLVRVSVFMMRKESVSEAEFHRYWTERHSKVASPWLIRHGVIKYTQFHTPSWSQQKAKESISVLSDSSYSIWDGVVELLMDNEKRFQEAIEDPYYEAVVKPDEEQFIDASKSRVQFGWEEVYIEVGNVVKLE